MDRARFPRRPSGDTPAPASRRRSAAIALVVLLGVLVVACAPVPAAPAGGAQAAAPVSREPSGTRLDGSRSSGEVAPAGGAAGATAPAPQALGPLTPVALEVPSGARVAPFGEPRALNLPAGFKAAVFAAGLTGPRLMTFDERGVLHVSLTRGGAVVALPDRDGDGVADDTLVVHEGMQRPHGLAFRDGWLYVAEESRVVRLRGGGDGFARPERQVLVDGLPAGQGHFTRTLGFGPDGGLYVSVGSSCNVCREADQRRAAIVRYEPDGSGERLYARGLRNAVGFVWRPGTAELWATNNGRDHLGDDQPPETLNLVRDGDDFGWPRCHNARIVDPQFGGTGACNGVAAPRAEMQAHAAPLGLAFWPDAHSVLVALHGSWNRSVPVPPHLVRVLLLPDGRAEVEEFATGWQLGVGAETRWGRPVDVVVGPDGSLYVSDDLAGAIYRLRAPG